MKKLINLMRVKFAPQGNVQIVRNNVAGGDISGGDIYQAREMQINYQGGKRKVVIDGVEVLNSMEQISINITGHVSKIDNKCGDIKITGDAHLVETVSGDVEITGNVNTYISSVSGDVNIGGDVGGSISTISGQVNASGGSRRG